jgi:hypothetical protein
LFPLPAQFLSPSKKVVATEGNEFDYHATRCWNLELYSKTVNRVKSPPLPVQPKNTGDIEGVRVFLSGSNIPSTTCQPGFRLH